MPFLPDSPTVLKRMPESPPTLQQQAIDWLLRLESADCTPAERAAFEAWLARDEGHERIYRQIARRWRQLDGFKGQDFPVRAAALTYRRPRRRLAESALAACLMLGLGVATFSERGWYGRNAVYATERGASRTVQLADGSRLELSPDSELTVHLDRWRRSLVLIKGEAYFDVAHDRDRPFQIEVGGASVVDLGTRFDVRLHNDEVAIAVVEGAVRVDHIESREIHANQALSFDRKGRFRELPANQIAMQTAWREGRLIFENRRLDEVLAELERYHDIRLTLADPALAKLKVSGTFHTDNLDAALNIIAMTLPIDIRRPNPRQAVLDKRGND
ncbi:FecR family protein [Methylomonas koyamae]